MEYETWTPGTKVPDWLEAHWKQNAPAELQGGSIQQRALALRRMYKEKEIKPKILFRALALDLLWACLPEGHRGGSRAIEMLMVEALGLPPGMSPVIGTPRGLKPAAAPNAKHWQRRLLSRGAMSVSTISQCRYIPSKKK